jgi:hypothetical protein
MYGNDAYLLCYVAKGIYELMFVSVFNGNLYTLDDRTGVVYQVSTL